MGTPALYMSEEFTTAVAEYEQDLGIRPGMLCAYDIDGRVADLCDPTVLATLGVERHTLSSPWKRIHLVDRAAPPTWTLAERLIGAGAAGVRVPSAQVPDGVNIVLWRWNVADGVRVAALDPLGDLPRDQSSWRQ